jgi:hypothetical protein
MAVNHFTALPASEQKQHNRKQGQDQPRRHDGPRIQSGSSGSLVGARVWQGMPYKEEDQVRLQGDELFSQGAVPRRLGPRSGNRRDYGVEPSQSSQAQLQSRKPGFGALMLRQAPSARQCGASAATPAYAHLMAMQRPRQAR